MMRRREGFTLVEMSIVIVIIGLLVGGVVIGKAMIRASELQSIPMSFQKYTTAIKLFKQKYSALPGDMPDATTFWGAVATGSACYSTSSLGTTLTCNGDGDGTISTWYTKGNEAMRIWQHLANAGLIEGNFSGVAGPGQPLSVTPQNTPMGRLPNSYFQATTDAPTGNTGYQFDGAYGNDFEFGLSGTDDDPYNPALTPTEAYKVDTKMDDGMPGKGKLVVRENLGWGTCTTASNSSQTSSPYLLSSNKVTCGFYYRNVF